MTGSIPLIATAVSAATLAGVVLAFLRGIRVRLAEHLGVSEDRLRGLAPVYTLGLVLLMLGTGLLIDKWGVQPVLVCSSLLAAVGIALVEAVTGLRAAWPGFALLATGAAGCATSAAVVAAPAFFNDNPAGALNLASVFFTLGVLATPPLAGWLIGRYGFRKGLLVVALLCLVPGAIALFPGQAEFSPLPAGGAGPRQIADVAHSPVLWLGALVLLCYRPLQEGFGNWSRPYLAEVGHQPEAVTRVFGLFWLTFLATRVACAFAVRPGFEAWWILGGSLLSGVVIGNLVGVFRKGGGVTGLMLLGMCMAPILPSALGAVLRLSPDAPGAATGLFLAAGLGGSLLIPSLIHPGAKRHSIRGAMRLSVVYALLVAAPAILLAVIRETP